MFVIRNIVKIFRANLLVRALKNTSGEGNKLQNYAVTCSLKINAVPILFQEKHATLQELLETTCISRAKFLSISFLSEFSAFQLEDKYETVRAELFNCKSQLSETEEEKARLELENHQVRFSRETSPSNYQINFSNQT